jgi:hypothetical protein
MEYVLDLQTLEAPAVTDGILADSFRSCKCCASTMSIVLCD